MIEWHKESNFSFAATVPEGRKVKFFFFLESNTFMSKGLHWAGCFSKALFQSLIDGKQTTGTTRNEIKWSENEHHLNNQAVHLKKLKRGVQGLCTLLCHGFLLCRSQRCEVPAWLLLGPLEAGSRVIPAEHLLRSWSSEGKVQFMRLIVIDLAASSASITQWCETGKFMTPYLQAHPAVMPLPVAKCKSSLVF